MEEFLKKSSARYENISSASGQDSEATGDREQQPSKTTVAPAPDKKGQKQAIEKNFVANQGYLTAFESFLLKDPGQNKGAVETSINPMGKVEERPTEKSFKLIASTLHPKKVLKAEKRKEQARERERMKELMLKNSSE